MVSKSLRRSVVVVGLAVTCAMVSHAPAASGVSGSWEVVVTGLDNRAGSTSDRSVNSMSRRRVAAGPGRVHQALRESAVTAAREQSRAGIRGPLRLSRLRRVCHPLPVRTAASPPGRTTSILTRSAWRSSPSALAATHACVKRSSVPPAVSSRRSVAASAQSHVARQGSGRLRGGEQSRRRHPPVWTTRNRFKSYGILARLGHQVLTDAGANALLQVRLDGASPRWRPSRTAWSLRRRFSAFLRVHRFPWTQSPRR